MTSKPSLDMLWEVTDPGDALTTRFGFTDVDHAAAWFRETLAEAWELRVESLDRLVISASKLLAWLSVDGKGFVAKCAVNPELFPRLADADSVVAWLHGTGLPVAAPLAAIDDRLRVHRGGYSVGLYPVVHGDLLDVDDAGQVESAGQMLATLHLALATYPGNFAGESGSQGQQLVHGDFRSANILQDGRGITAVLDFDEASYRSRTAELGQAAVLLGTRYQNWQATTPATRESFVSAYNDVSPLSNAERDEVEHVIHGVLDHFGWK